MLAIHVQFSLPNHVRSVQVPPELATNLSRSLERNRNMSSVKNFGLFAAAVAACGIVACAGSKAEGTDKSMDMSADGGMMMSADGGMSSGSMGGAMKTAESDMGSAAGKAGADMKAGASTAAGDMKNSGTSMAMGAADGGMMAAKSEGTSMGTTAKDAAASAGSTMKADAAAADSMAKAGPTDAQIAAIAVAANQAEIDASKYAAKHSKNAKVKSAAKGMVKDHTKVGKDAVALVTKLGVTPEESDTSKAEADAGKKNLDNLKTLKGAELDKAYVDNEVTCHEGLGKALDDTLIPNAKNEELKALLVSIKPIVAAHLAHMKSLQDSMSGAAK